MNRTHNYQTKNIRDFAPGDTLYIQKTENGLLITYLVKNAGYSRGIVKGEIVSVEPKWAEFGSVGTTVTTRLSKCYLYDANARYGRCRWFQKDGFADSSARD